MIRIAVDSSADFTKEEIQKYNLELLKQPTIFDGCIDPVEDEKVFWQKLKEGSFPKTSQPTPYETEELFNSVKDEDALIYIVISSELSGTFRTADAIRERMNKPNIFVIDSRMASMAEKMLVYKAIELRDKGEQAKDIAEFLNRYKSRIKLIACLDTLKFLSLGGRISKLTASVGALLKIKIMMTFNREGKIEILGKHRGRANALKATYDVVKGDRVSSDQKLIPIFSDGDDNCNEMIEGFKSLGYTDMRESMSIGATIGAHIGPNAFGIVYVMEEDIA